MGKEAVVAKFKIPVLHLSGGTPRKTSVRIVGAPGRLPNKISFHPTCSLKWQQERTISNNWRGVSSIPGTAKNEMIARLEIRYVFKWADKYQFSLTWTAENERWATMITFLPLHIQTRSSVSCVCIKAFFSFYGGGKARFEITVTYLQEQIIPKRKSRWTWQHIQPTTQLNILYTKLRLIFRVSQRQFHAVCEKRMQNRVTFLQNS
jgi:hypothetical protein